MLIPAHGARAQNVTPSGDPAPVPAVRLIAPSDAEARATRSFFGRIAARETVELSFEIGGKLLDFTAREGSTVPKGFTLATLDRTPLERAVERAELSLAQAQRDFGRSRRLAESNVASEARAQDSRTARDLADVALRDAREALADSVLVAPFEGIVAQRIAAQFANVAAGQPIVVLHDMSEVRVEIEVPERLLLSVGDPSQVRFEGVLPDGRPTHLRLAEYEATTGRVGQSFRVSLAIPEDRDGGLIPGASMTVTAALSTPNARILLPMSALVANEGDEGFHVMVFRPDGDGTGIVERNPVEVTAERGTGFEVSGLAPDARIVEAGAHLLSPGQKVRIYDGLTVEAR